FAPFAATISPPLPRLVGTAPPAMFGSFALPFGATGARWMLFTVSWPGWGEVLSVVSGCFLVTRCSGVSATWPLPVLAGALASARRRPITPPDPGAGQPSSADVTASRPTGPDGVAAVSVTACLNPATP